MSVGVVSHDIDYGVGPCLRVGHSFDEIKYKWLGTHVQSSFQLRSPPILFETFGMF